MRSIFFNFLIFGLSFLVFSCDPTPNRKDTGEVAEEQNEERIEETTPDTAAMGTEDKREDDAEFMVEAASGGMMEVELGKLAQQKAQTKEVKNFAKMMVTDHSKANTELKALAAKKNITVPTAMADKHQTMYNNLKDKTGLEFDKDYMDMMVSDHRDDVDMFEDKVEDAKDADIKAFASKTLTVLRMHYDSAQRIQNIVKDKK